MQLSEITVDLFVRKELDPQRVLFFKDLYGNGVHVEPMWVTESGRLIAGRHRLEAHILRKDKMVKVKTFHVTSDTELIAMAYRENTGGSKPPTDADSEHTVMLLLDRGESVSSIARHLGLPMSMTRRHVKEVRSKMNRTKLLQAAALVTEKDMTVIKAAEQCGVDPNRLKEVLTGTSRRKRVMGVDDIGRNITVIFRSAGSKNAALLRKVMEKFEDGDMTQKQVRTVFSQIEGLQKRQTRAISDWKKRFDSLVANKR